MPGGCRLDQSLKQACTLRLAASLTELQALKNSKLHQHVMHAAVYAYIRYKVFRVRIALVEELFCVCSMHIKLLDVPVLQTEHQKGFR